MGSRSCSTDCGDVRSVAYRVLSIAARVIQTGDPESGDGRKSTKEVAGSTATGSGGDIVGISEKRDSEGAVDFATQLYYK